MRGPLYLKQFAYYTPSTSSSKVKRDTRPKNHEREEALEDSQIQERATTLTCPGSNSTTYVSNGETFIVECGLDRPGNMGMVYTTTFSACIDKCATTTSCVDVSYLPNGGGACYMKSSIIAPNPNSNVYGARFVSSSSSSTSSKSSSSSTTSTKGSTTLTTSTKTSTTSTSTSTTKPTSSSTSSTTTSKATSSTSTTSSSSTSPAATGSTWTRQSYYSSSAGTASNVMFLNTNGGGSVSGVWSSYFGSSLSYASSNGLSAASSPQILSDAPLSSAAEIALFTSTACTTANPCGYYRPGIPAYHGFGGASKIFLLEFSMPNDSSGNNQPAIWLLNALIPRTQQYGSCNCWGNTNGCGELDVFETLDAGETRMTSSIHGNQAGGDSDYFLRPTSGTIKAAIVLDSEQAHIKILNSAFVIGSTLSASDYASLFAVGDSYVAGNVSSVTLS